MRQISSAVKLSTGAISFAIATNTSKITVCDRSAEWVVLPECVKTILEYIEIDSAHIDGAEIIQFMNDLP